MSDVNISKFRAQVVRDGSKPATPGFVVSEGQSPTDPAGSGQNHLPVTIAAASTGLAITESQILGGAGTVAQYIRGDGSLADFPATTGGGSSVSYYLNGSVSQGTIGGVAYKELNRNPVFGAGTDISINSDGYIANFITDAGDPNKLEIPAGNWNLETYFSASSGGGNPTFYVELYKYNGTTFTLIASNASSPELIAFGTNLNPYFSTLAVPQTTLALTDRLALRYYVTTSGRTITLHTENNHLCQVITTFTTGLTALNGLTTQVQFFAVGTSGTDFNIASATDTHTFNLPTATATIRGALSSSDWSTFNNKENAITAGTTAQYFRGDKTFQTLNTAAVPELTNLYYTEARVNANTNVAANTAARHNAVTIGTANGLSLSTQVLSLGLASAGVTGALSGTDWSTFNSKQNALTNPVTGTGTSGQVAYFTGTSAISSESNLFWDATNDRLGINVTPSFSLDVNGTGRFSGALTGTTATFGSTGTGNNVIAISNNDQSNVRLRITNTGSGGRTYSLVGGLNAANNSSFSIFDETAASTRFEINSSGAATFSSSVTAGGDVLLGFTANRRFGVDLNSGEYFYGISSNSNARQTRVISAAADGNLGISFETGNTYTTVTPKMTITSGGNLLVGTTTDAGFKLDVNGTGRFTQNVTIGAATAATNVKLIFNGVASKAAGIEFHQSGTPQWYIGNGIASEDNNFELYNSNGTMAMKIIKSTNAINFIGAATFSSTLDTGGRITITADAGNEQFNIRRASNTNQQLILGYHSDGYGRIQAVEQNVAFRPLVLNQSGGNVLIGTTTDVGAKLYVNGGIRTANPNGSTSNDWLLGRALTSGTSSPDRWIRVQIGNLYYDILAVYMGSV